MVKRAGGPARGTVRFTNSHGKTAGGLASCAGARRTRHRIARLPRLDGAAEHDVRGRGLLLDLHPGKGVWGVCGVGDGGWGWGGWVGGGWGGSAQRRQGPERGAAAQRAVQWVPRGPGAVRSIKQQPHSAARAGWTPGDPACLLHLRQAGRAAGGALLRCQPLLGNLLGCLLGPPLARVLAGLDAVEAAEGQRCGVGCVCVGVDGEEAEGRMGAAAAGMRVGTRLSRA